MSCSGGSAFDNYDKENGYNDFEFEEQRRNYKDIVYMLYRKMIAEGSSYKDCTKVDFCDYIDYLCYCLDNPIENESEVI